MEKQDTKKLILIDDYSDDFVPGRLDGGYIVKNYCVPPYREYLDINKKEPFSQVPWRTLIQQQEEKGLPLLLAVVKKKLYKDELSGYISFQNKRAFSYTRWRSSLKERINSGTLNSINCILSKEQHENKCLIPNKSVVVHRYYDAIALNKELFGRSKYNKIHNTYSYQKSPDIGHSIRYYMIESTNNARFKYIAQNKQASWDSFPQTYLGLFYWLNKARKGQNNKALAHCYIAENSENLYKDWYSNNIFKDFSFKEFSKKEYLKKVIEDCEDPRIGCEVKYKLAERITCHSPSGAIQCFKKIFEQTDSKQLKRNVCYELGSLMLDKENYKESDYYFEQAERLDEELGLYEDSIHNNMGLLIAGPKASSKKNMSLLERANKSAQIHKIDLPKCDKKKVDDEHKEEKAKIQEDIQKFESKLKKLINKNIHNNHGKPTLKPSKQTRKKHKKRTFRSPKLAEKGWNYWRAK